MIDMAFDYSERYPDTWVDLKFTDDGLLYFSFSAAQSTSHDQCTTSHNGPGDPHVFLRGQDAKASQGSQEL